jgi:hypothetical protein
MVQWSSAAQGEAGSGVALVYATPDREFAFGPEDLVKAR